MNRYLADRFMAAEHLSTAHKLIAVALALRADEAGLVWLDGSGLIEATGLAPSTMRRNRLDLSRMGILMPLDPSRRKRSRFRLLAPKPDLPPRRKQRPSGSQKRAVSAGPDMAVSGVSADPAMGLSGQGIV